MIFSTHPYMRRRMRYRMAKRGVSITLRWVVYSGAPTEDPTTGSTIGDGNVQTAMIKGFFAHADSRANANTINVRHYGEIEDGDAWVDIPVETVIEGRKQLSFVIDGREWVQKKTGERIAQQHQITHGQRVYRTLLLTLRK